MKQEEISDQLIEQATLLALDEMEAQAYNLYSEQYNQGEALQKLIDKYILILKTAKNRQKLGRYFREKPLEKVIPLGGIFPKRQGNPTSLVLLSTKKRNKYGYQNQRLAIHRYTRPQ